MTVATVLFLAAAVVAGVEAVRTRALLPAAICLLAVGHAV